MIDGEAGAFGIVFPDLDGCTAMGDTLDAAIGHAAEALRDWVTATEARAKVPAPSAIETLRRDPNVARAGRRRDADDHSADFATPGAR